jgi:hypothetical protein
MAHDREHTHHALSTVVKAERSAVPRMNPASQVERRIHTDEHTHAKSYYERDGAGRETYATYYNSNDDPTFQARYNTNGRHAFVSASSFTFVSNGNNSRSSASARKSPRAPVYAPTAIVEEAASPEPETHTRHASRTHTTPTAQPIVEEPDDDDDGSKYAYMDDVRKSHGPRYGAVDHLSSFHHENLPSRRNAPARYHGDDTMAYQLSPFVQPNALMRDFFMDDFFDGPRGAFGMMDAMRQHMSRQRAAMFGGVDPFANFF